MTPRKLHHRAAPVLKPLKRLRAVGWRRAFRYVFWSGMGLAGLVLAWVLFWVIPRLPDVTHPENLLAAQSSVIADRDGAALYTIHAEENRQNVPLAEIAPPLVKAVLAMEDDRFYEHGGVDFGAILKAVCHELLVCPQPRGGSTITQQYIKNTFLSPERSYVRKLREILLALELERRFNKDQILELYLNRIPYGSSLYGAELAAQTFFGKPARDLTLAESSVLAAVPKAPSYYSPYGAHLYPLINLSEAEVLKHDLRSEEDLLDYDSDSISKGLLGKAYAFGEGATERTIYVKGRTDFVLGRLLELGDITAEESVAALKEANALTFKPYRETIRAPHFVMMVREEIEAQYGKETLEKGGLVITTTLDAALQEAAEKAVEAHGENNEKIYGASNASLVALHPDTGEVLAMVGSRDYWNDDIDGKVNVALRPRLPGSSFKPIVYASAFLSGYAPSTVVYDVKTDFGQEYMPENYDGQEHGAVSFREALARSLNIPAVKAAALAGVSNVLTLARQMGIALDQGEDWYGLSLALGAGEVRLLDLASAYGTFASGGYKVKPFAILKIADRDGNILFEHEQDPRRELILDPQVAFLVSDVLSDVQARPAGFWRDQITLPGQIAAAKTGTSNKKVDEENVPLDTWTMGYTRRLAAGVWVGNNRGEPLKPKADGLGAASPIWLDFMKAATRGKAEEPFDKPDGIRWVTVSKKTGLLPGENTPPEDQIAAPFASFSLPREAADEYEWIELDAVTGKRATEFTPLELVERKAFLRLRDFIPEDYPKWREAIETWAKTRAKTAVPPTDFDDVHTGKPIPTGEVDSFAGQAITVLRPAPGTVIAAGETVRVQVGVDEASRGLLKSLTLFGKNADGKNLVLAKIPVGGPEESVLSFNISAPPAGRYELYLKAVPASGGIRFSERAAVLVR